MPELSDYTGDLTLAEVGRAIQTASSSGVFLTEFGSISGAAADNSTLFNDAVAELNDRYDSTGLHQNLIVPPGAYRLDSSIDWLPGVSLFGAGRKAVTLLPYGEVAAIDGNQSGVQTVWYDNCVFSGFTIDGQNQTADPDGTSWTKGIFIQFLRRALFAKIDILNVAWTGFGLDYLLDGSIMIDCYAENCGRAKATATGEALYAGAGAGFGIATGFYDDEDLTIILCGARGNQTHGFFTENKSSGPIKLPRGFRLTHCWAEQNASGFSDSGNTGAQASHCRFVNNRNCGVIIDRTPANLEGGKDGHIHHCYIGGNGINDLDAGTGPGGVVLRNMENGGYKFSNNEVIGNAGPGFRGASIVCHESIDISDNVIKNNQGPAVWLSGAGTLVDLMIDRNTCINNSTTSTITQRAAIVIDAPTTDANITNNRAINTAGGRQASCVQFVTPTRASTRPQISGNTLKGGVRAISYRHITTDKSLISGNITRDFGTELVSNGVDLTDTADWVDARGNATLSVVDGNLRVTADDNQPFGASIPVTGLTIGVVYGVRIATVRGAFDARMIMRIDTASTLSGGTVLDMDGPNQGGDEADYCSYFTATATTHYLGCVGTNHDAAQFFDISEVSLRVAI